MTKCKALTGSAVKGLSRFVTNRDKSRWLSSCRIKFDGGSTRRRQAKSIRIDFRCPSGLLMRVDCQVYSSQGRRHDVFLGGGESLLLYPYSRRPTISFPLLFLTHDVSLDRLQESVSQTHFCYKEPRKRTSGCKFCYFSLQLWLIDTIVTIHVSSSSSNVLICLLIWTTVTRSLCYLRNINILCGKDKK